MPRPVRLLLAALASGIAFGLAGRLAMRVIALESGLPGAFSLGGSVEVVVFGALVGGPATLAFLLLRPRLRTRAVWPGIVFGLVVLGSLVLSRPPSATSALLGTPDTPALTFVTFGVLVMAWGLSLEGLHRRLGRGLDSRVSDGRPVE